MEDHNLLAVFDLESMSDSSYNKASTLPIAQSEELLVDQEVHNSVHLPGWVQRLGERVLARVRGGPGKGSIWRNPQVPNPQTTQSHSESEVQGGQAAPVTEISDELRP